MGVVGEPDIGELPVGVARLDTKGRFVWLNARAAALAGMSAEDAAGRTFSEVFQFAPQDLFTRREGNPVMMIVTNDPGRAVMIERTPVDDGEVLAVMDATARYRALLELRASHWVADRTGTRLQLVIDASIALASATSESGLASVLTIAAARAYRAEASAVFLLGDSGALHLAAGSNPLEALLEGEGAAEWVRDLREVVQVSGVGEAATLAPALGDEMQQQGVHALLIAPIYHEDVGYGVFACFFLHPREFDDEAAPLALALAGQAGQALATLRLQERLAHAATHDDTTGLPNRRLLELQVTQAAAPRARRLAVLFLDVDRFKAINDTFGHVIGDGVLREVAERLQAGVRAGDLVARYGGDEFVILCEVDDVDAAIELAERLRVSIRRPLRGIDSTFTIGASIGVALTQSGATAELDEVIRAADHAMYRAKSAGGDRVVSA